MDPLFGNVTYDWKSRLRFSHTNRSRRWTVLTISVLIDNHDARHLERIAIMIGFSPSYCLLQVLGARLTVALV